MQALIQNRSGAGCGRAIRFPQDCWFADFANGSTDQQSVSVIVPPLPWKDEGITKEQTRATELSDVQPVSVHTPVNRSFVYCLRSRMYRLNISPLALTYLWPPCVADADIIFCTYGFFFLSFFHTYSQLSEIRCLPYFYTWCGLSANLECRSEMC